MAPLPLSDLNAGYIQEILADYLAAPDSVDPAWRELFEAPSEELLQQLPALRRLRELGALTVETDGHAPTAEASVPQEPPDTLLGVVASAVALVSAYRTHGHLAAQLDPLGSDPLGDPALDPERHEPQLTPELLRRVPTRFLRLYVPGETLADALPRLRETYCGTIAYEIEHISNHAQRVWLRRAIESWTYREQLSTEERVNLLRRLSQVEAFERYLRRAFAFLGQKQFSIEGLDVLVPMLDEVMELAARAGTSEVHIGMAHRGRLNVLAHTLERSYEVILREFESERVLEAIADPNPEIRSGDVKYHLGAEGVHTTAAGKLATVLAANPSHLEAVDPVVEGATRVSQTAHTSRTGDHDPTVALAVLIHGDAAFPAQGVVSETLNLLGLAGYETGGTLHLIANNQLGFTTDPEEGRSTRYASDLAKGFDAPIIHVNADDPEAAVSAVQLAMAFRQQFHRDVVVDLVGYRRFGHNEQDEPAYTQPLVYETIEQHPTVRDLYAARLVEVGCCQEQEPDEFVGEVDRRIHEAHEALKAEIEAHGGRPRPRPEQTPPLPRTTPRTETKVSKSTLRTLNEQLLAVPDGFTVHPKLLRQLERRRETLGPEGGIDWAQAEALAFASLLGEGIPIRLTGQDTERGTFSHRHIVLHDERTGERFVPIQQLPDAKASFEVYNSPLSEYAALGFEYGYSIGVPGGLVLWEAQFGDFFNNAEVIVDQFIASGLAKWSQTSRLTLLLPHGYEGNGPEHSSARVERFLQLAAQGNMRIGNCSTPAQYFHLLRLQALGSTPRPLVIFTPKGLLRAKEATSSLQELSEGTFKPVFDDPNTSADRRWRVKRLVLCSGKIYYDLVGSEGYADADEVAVARLDQLYPFPVPAYLGLLDGYPRIEELVWVQEEPQNMGPWRSIRHRIEESLPQDVRLRYVGRNWRASPAEGYPTAHLLEQNRIIREALTVLS